MTKKRTSTRKRRPKITMPEKVGKRLGLGCGFFFLFILFMLLLQCWDAEAAVKRGQFTSNGYVQHHERNDYKGNGKGYQGYRPYRPY